MPFKSTVWVSSANTSVSHTERIGSSNIIFAFYALFCVWVSLKFYKSRWFRLQFIAESPLYAEWIFAGFLHACKRKMAYAAQAVFSPQYPAWEKRSSFKWHNQAYSTGYASLLAERIQRRAPQLENPTGIPTLPNRHPSSLTYFQYIFCSFGVLFF